MDQRAFLALTAMLEAFPQTTANVDLRVATFEAVLQGVTSQAVIETAERFAGGLVEGQSLEFAPSSAKFAVEARRVDGLIPYRNRPRLAAPKADTWRPHPKEDRIRMGFKMTLLSTAIGLGKVDDVAKANAQGLEALMALGQKWGVPVPDELWKQVAA